VGRERGRGEVTGSEEGRNTLSKIECVLYMIYIYMYRKVAQ
jgi:hypothetical protein